MLDKLKTKIESTKEKMHEAKSNAVGKAQKAVATARIVMRRTAYAVLGAGTIVIGGPYALEKHHQSTLDEKSTQAVEKITKEKFYTCLPERAGAQQSQRGEKLAAVIKAALSPAPHSLGETYDDGLRRMTNSAPGLTHFAKKHIPGFSDLPEGYYKGSFETDGDRQTQSTTRFAQLGITACFDEALSAVKAGSAFVPEHGIVTLNPSLSDEAMIDHTRRQFANIEREVVIPYTRDVLAAQKESASYTERFDAIENLAAQHRRPPMTLSLQENPATAAFAKAIPGSYRPPFAETATTAPTPQPASVTGSTTETVAPPVKQAKEEVVTPEPIAGIKKPASKAPVTHAPKK